jgi:protein SCO1/2
MSETSRRNVLAALTLGPLGLALAGSIANAQTEQATLAGKRVWEPRPTGSIASRTFPNVEVVSQEGKKYRFYEDLIKDRIVVINFFYAHCTKFCPPATANMVKVQKELGDRLGKEIFIYSLTLDPKHDTPEVLHDYAQMYGTKPGWTFLTGKAEDMELLRVKLGFRDSDPVVDKDRGQHIGVIRYGNDALNRWSACPALGSVEEIMRELASLNPGTLEPIP